MKECGRLTDLMTQRCAEDKSTHAQALLIVGIVGAVACVNYAFQIVPALLLISTTLMTSAFLLHESSAFEEHAPALLITATRELH